MKPWYTSRLIWLGIAQSGIAVAEFIGAWLRDTPSPDPHAYVLLATGILTIIVRFLTTKAVGSNAKPGLPK